ncbi:homeobox-leucine zipper protein ANTHOCYANINLESS 2 isoform X1 [Carica papaya]|uniref:homeobox-leucine zipper protein ANTHOCYANINLESS 2 isoform X1 n=2 Tax=Carica papaya TaxID=3649 RepID=UPI000B8C8B27|nr:homeobox-leucine zipper protein ANTHOCYANINLESS 2 isoform X1 [Carica papaya]
MNFGGLIKSSSSSNTAVVSRIVAAIGPQGNMPGDAIAQPPLYTQQPIPKSMRTTTIPLSLSIKSKMDDHDELGLLGENFDPGLIGRMREDGYESRSGSDNFEGASGDDQDAGEDEPPRKKKYHRHTPHQIQELEFFFKECPHPDEKQRSELSKRLGLENKQIKFWFQNRRTQMKTQLERHENVILRQENDKLRTENELLKEAMRNPMCNNCGGPGMAGEISYEQHQLRIENARLKDELGRVCALANKFFGGPMSSLASPVPPSCLNSNLELAVGRNDFGGMSTTGTTLPMVLEFGDGALMPLMKPMGNEMVYERSMFVDLALAAMDELIKMVHTDSPLWIKSLDGRRDLLNHEEYMRTFSPCIGMKPNGFVSEASRESGLVIINSLALVEMLMDANRWMEMFPCIIVRAVTVDVISSGTGGTRSGALQVMQSEFQVLSPLVPTRQVRFLRFCKQHAEGVWAVVDVSIDITQDGPNAQLHASCRRLPSGCIVQDMANGCSKVTWVEHSEYDESAVHPLYRTLVSAGSGFGAHRWIATLQRQCECLAILMSSTLSTEDHSGFSAAGKKSMLKLAQRMTYNFCTGVCASSVRKWDKLQIGNVSEDVKVMTRKNINEAGEPPGVVLSAATSVWMPVTQERLFNFLRDERLRSEWDILSNGGPMQEMLRIAKGEERGNCVSLMRASANDGNENSMLILQETWSDASGAVVVYAPVDISCISVVMGGGDSTYVALLPSGFGIVPLPPNKCKGAEGCILTVGFQILVNSLPTAKLTVESVETVNNLISCTIQKIKASVSLTSP